jgi:hypothetical protein
MPAYKHALQEIARALADTAPDLRVLLVQDSYSFDAQQKMVSEAAGEEATMNGYARVKITGKALLVDEEQGCTYLDADEPIFAGLSGREQALAGAIVFRHTGNDRTAPMLAFYPLPGHKIGGQIEALRVQWAAPEQGGMLLLKSGESSDV